MQEPNIGRRPAPFQDSALPYSNFPVVSLAKKGGRSLSPSLRVGNGRFAPVLEPRKKFENRRPSKPQITLFRSSRAWTRPELETRVPVPPPRPKQKWSSLLSEV